MNKIIVYHGSTHIVQQPIRSFGRPNLDFGQGFYVTDLRKQALEWAQLVANRKKEQPALNR
jgi:predicted nucleic acid-binding Zn ribbon protein